MEGGCKKRLIFMFGLGSKEFRELPALNWLNTTCRDIRTAVIKTCAYTNRYAYALKCAFGKEYNDFIY